MPAAQPLLAPSRQPARRSLLARAVVRSPLLAFFLSLRRRFGGFGAFGGITAAFQHCTAGPFLVVEMDRRKRLSHVHNEVRFGGPSVALEPRSLDSCQPRAPGPLEPRAEAVIGALLKRVRPVSSGMRLVSGPSVGRSGHRSDDPPCRSDAYRPARTSPPPDSAVPKTA